MRIIGSYKPELQSWYFQQLTELAVKAVSAGDFGGGKLLGPEAVERLKRQAEEFSGVPFVLSGERATEDSIQRAVDLLSSKYLALAEERNQFVQTLARFLAVLRQDNRLGESLVLMSDTEEWIRSRPHILGARRWWKDFAISPGTVPASPASDKVDVVCRKEAVDSFPRTGIAGRRTETQFPPASMSWSCSAEGEKEELYGEGWAKLSVLAPRSVTFFGDPEVRTITPSNVTPADWKEFFSVSGRNGDANVPVYIRNFFLPRRTVKETTFDIDFGENLRLSEYRVSPDDIQIYEDDHYFFRGVDYLITDDFRIQPLRGILHKTVTVVFTEFYPAVQYSIDGKTWSSPVMLDPARPVPDSSDIKVPFPVIGNRFPVTDEVGNPTGLFLELLKPVSKEFTVMIQNARPAGSRFGMVATLEIEFDKPRFMNGIRLEPFASLPVNLRSVYAEGILGSNPGYVWRGDYPVNRTQDVFFADREVLKLKLEFWQENYTTKEHLVDVENRKKLEAMISIQSILPYEIRNTKFPLTRYFTGYQYDFGFRSIIGLNSGNAPETVLINGPFEFPGVPDVIRLDTDAVSQVDVDFYVLTKETARNGTVSGLASAKFDNESGVYTPVYEETEKVDFYVKTVLKTRTAVARRFLLQVK